MFGLNTKTTRVRRGTISLSNPVHFPPHRELEAGKAGDIAAGVRQALDEAQTNRIGAIGENDGNGTGFPLQDLDGHRTSNDDHIWRPGNELSCFLLQPAGLGVREACVNGDAVFRPTQAAQSLGESRDKGLPLRIGTAADRQQAHLPLSRMLFCDDGDRREDRRAADQEDEFASSHLLISGESQRSRLGRIAFFHRSPPIDSLTPPSASSRSTPRSRWRRAGCWCPGRRWRRRPRRAACRSPEAG